MADKDERSPMTREQQEARKEFLLRQLAWLKLREQAERLNEEFTEPEPEE
jgi:hypothetical protein